MNTQLLEQKTRQEWEFLNERTDTIALTEFEKDVERFGGYEAAYCQLKALNLAESCLDAYELITIHFNFQPENWNYELRQQILEAFLQLPDGLELLQMGCEQLVNLEQHPDEEQFNGIFELVKRAGEQRRLTA